MHFSQVHSKVESSFIQKFQLDFCKNIPKVHSVLARSKIKEAHNFLNKKFSVSLDKGLFQFDF